jgi:hypothetical protein
MTEQAISPLRPRKVAPIRYVAGLVGTDTDSDRAGLIVLMVLCCDPLAIALTAAAFGTAII